jgi:hypothetical protein
MFHFDFQRLANQRDLLSCNDQWDQYFLGLAIKNHIHSQPRDVTTLGMADFLHNKVKHEVSYTFCRKFAENILDNKVPLDYTKDA